MGPGILATGAIEQHGPHLPVSVDACWAGLALACPGPAAPGASCYVAPAITVGKSNEHAAFPHPRDLEGHAEGASPGHGPPGARLGIPPARHPQHAGGNISVIAYTLRESRDLRSPRDLLRRKPRPGLSAGGGLRVPRGELETSLMLAAAGGLVRMGTHAASIPPHRRPGELRPEAAPATFSWATQDGRGRASWAMRGPPRPKRNALARIGAAKYAGQIADLCRSGKRRRPDRGHDPGGRLYRAPRRRRSPGREAPPWRSSRGRHGKLAHADDLERGQVVGQCNLQAS